MSRPYDRAATEPGGCECMTCGVIFVGAEWHTECAICAARPAPPVRDTCPECNGMASGVGGKCRCCGGEGTVVFYPIGSLSFGGPQE